MFQSTRRRLALWYTCVTAVVLVMFAIGVYGYVRYTLIDRIDDTLNHVAEVVERSIRAEARQDPEQVPRFLVWRELQEIGDNGSLSLGDDQLSEVQTVKDLTASETRDKVNTLPDFEATEFEDDHIDLEWFSPNGDLHWASSPHMANLPLESGFHTVYLTSGSGLRQMTDPVMSGDRLLGYLRISHPWFEVTKPIRQLTLDLVLGLGAMVASVGMIGWLLSGLAMRPVRESYDRLKQFTADASHELRSPIASLQTTVQTNLRDPDLDLPTRQSWERVERLTRRLGHLVEDLLFLARQDQRDLQTITRSHCDLDGILLQVEAEQRAFAAQKQINLELDIPDTSEDYGLQADPGQLLRLLTNLVTNSLQYTPEGGEVQIQLRRIPAGQAKPTQMRIKVQDNGPGIPADALPHVFDRFYRADPARTHTGAWPQGTGLGLSIAKSIVERHQGGIQVESQEGQGTTVTVILPEAEE
jgi:OmpR-family two-component system manganese-sensing sensor histidine kinase